MLRILIVLVALGAADFGLAEDVPVNYFGHKVITATPKTEEHLQTLQGLREQYGVDLWNEPRGLNIPVMMRLKPELVDAVLLKLKDIHMEYFVAFHDLQSVILAEKISNAPTNERMKAADFDFGKYHTLNEIIGLIQDLTTTYPDIAKLETIGSSYENRPIYLVKVTSGTQTAKPAILIECGIHAREWSSVAAGIYLLNRLLTQYGKDDTITSLVDKYEFYIIPEANPDGYLFTWSHDRLWRKTRSHSSVDWLGVCRGADANRNYDIDHCGVGTSRKPCDDIYCGDKPFSESETRAIRDIMKNIGNSRMKAYFTLHAFSQLWMTPYGIKKSLPPNYDELVRVGTAGTDALAKRYGTVYKLGSIANIIYEAAGSSVDYAYVKENMTMSFALELRDTGRHGFFLPNHLILPMCEETFDGLQAAILAL